MRAFVSYASEQRATAERLAIGLRNAGLRVFFDRVDLPAGEAFDGRIRDAVARAHLFIFLVTEDSLRAGGYCLSELSIAEHRWPNPSSHVLPVLLEDLPIEKLPPYLRALSVLRPVGDPVADTLSSVARLIRNRRRRWLRLATPPAMLMLAASGWLLAAKNKKNGTVASGASAAAFVAPSEASPIEAGVGRTEPNSSADTVGDKEHRLAAGGQASAGGDSSAKGAAPKLVAPLTLTVGEVRAVSGEPGRFRFQGEMVNSGTESLMPVGFEVRVSARDIRIGTDTELGDHVAAGARRRFRFFGNLYDSDASSSFKWQLCLRYVRTADYFELGLAGDNNPSAMERFVARYGQLTCAPPRTWTPLAAVAE